MILNATTCTSLNAVRVLVAHCQRWVKHKEHASSELIITDRRLVAGPTTAVTS